MALSGFHTPKAVTYHETYSNVIDHDRSQPWANGDVVWLGSPAPKVLWDPIARILSPDAACCAILMYIIHVVCG